MRAQDYYPDCPEPMLVGLARGGDRAAFGEIVSRRQSALRNLMRRMSGDAALADDLAQQVFLKAWLSLRRLRAPSAFPAWFRRVAVTTWLEHARRNDALQGAGELSGAERATREHAGVAMDLDRALATLTEGQRLCVVLSYHEGLSHREIAEATGLPLGTVKSHINRGAEALREALAAYGDAKHAEVTA